MAHNLHSPSVKDTTIVPSKKEKPSSIEDGGYDLAYALSAKPSLPVSRGSNDMLLTAVLLTQDLRYASPSQFPSDVS